MESKEIREIEYNRHSTIAKMLDTQDLAKVSRILEVGCHVGFSTHVFAKEAILENKEYVGIDIDADALREAEMKKSEFGWDNVQFRKLSLFDLDNLFFEEFDLVITEEVLEHTDIIKSLKCIWPVLKPHGLLIFSVPYKETKECGKRWGHKVYGLDERKIKKILEETGFSLDRFTILDVIWPPPEPSEKVLFVKANKVRKRIQAHACK